MKYAKEFQKKIKMNECKKVDNLICKKESRAKKMKLTIDEIFYRSIICSLMYLITRLDNLYSVSQLNLPIVQKTHLRVAKNVLKYM